MQRHIVHPDQELPSLPNQLKSTYIAQSESIHIQWIVTPKKQTCANSWENDHEHRINNYPIMEEERYLIIWLLKKQNLQSNAQTPIIICKQIKKW